MLIDTDTAKRLRKAYQQAVKEEKEAFEFEGNTFLTKYAYYLLEYLKMEGVIK
jgi:hypothetical protein